MRSHRLPSQQGGAMLFFIAALIPLLVLAGVVALDINADRIGFNTAVRNAQRSSQMSMGSLLSRALSRFDNPLWSFSGSRIGETIFTPNSPILRAMLLDEKSLAIPVYSSSRIVPTSVSIIFSKESFLPFEARILKHDILKVWESLEDKKLPFELATIREGSVLRLTSRRYQTTLGISQRALMREKVMQESFEVSSNDAIAPRDLLRYARNLVFSVARERHMQHVIVLLSASSFYGVEDIPLELLDKAGLCSGDALEFLVVVLEVSSAKHPGYWSDKKVCHNGKTLRISLDRVHMKAGSLVKAIVSILRSVLHVEVIA